MFAQNLRTIPASFEKQSQIFNLKTNICNYCIVQIKQNRNKSRAISKLHFVSFFSRRATAVAPSLSSNTQKKLKLLICWAVIIAFDYKLRTIEVENPSKAEKLSKLQLALTQNLQVLVKSETDQD